jgi:HSP20 family molecular chaperone IbpA
MANVLTKQDNRNEPARSQPTRSAPLYTPRCDIYEAADELVLLADLPGVKPQDVDLKFENGELLIQGRCSPRQNDVEFLGCEYGVGDFYRAFTISEAVDTGRISAELKQGVLTVHLPKSEAVKPKRIAVKGE